MIVVSDAGPLIHLSVVGRLDLLPERFGRVLVPDVVLAEVVDRGAERPGAAEVRDADWIEPASTEHLAASIAELPAALDPGERAAIAVALERGADYLLCDDRRGRAEAERRKLPVAGTLGVLLWGRRAGHVDALAPLLEQLRGHGFHASEPLLAVVLKLAGEQPRQHAEE